MMPKALRITNIIVHGFEVANQAVPLMSSKNACSLDPPGRGKSAMRFTLSLNAKARPSAKSTDSVSHCVPRAIPFTERFEPA